MTVLQSVWSAGERVRRVNLRGRNVRRVMMLTGSAVIGQGVLIAVSPVLTRLYLPADFGVLAVFMSVVYVLMVISALHYEAAIFVPEDHETAAAVLALSLVFVTLTSGALAVLLWLFGDVIVRVVRIPELRPYLWLLPICMWGSGIFRALNNWAIRTSAYKRMAFTRLEQGVLVAVTQVILGLFRLGPIGLLLGTTLGSVSGSEVLSSGLWRWHRHVVTQLSWTRIRSAAARYRDYVVMGAPASLLSSIGLSLPVLLLAMLYNAQVVGWFSLAVRVVGRPLQLVAVSVSHVYLGAASNAATHEPRELPRLFMQVLGGMVIISLPWILVLTVLAPWAFPVVFGAEWKQAGFYLQILAVMFFVEVVVSPTSETVDALHRQDLHLMREVLRLAMLGVAIAGMVGFNLGPTTAVIILSGAGTLTNLAFCAISFYAIRQHIHRQDRGCGADTDKDWDDAAATG